MDGELHSWGAMWQPTKQLPEGAIANSAQSLQRIYSQSTPVV